MALAERETASFRHHLWPFLELFGLAGLVIAQPTLEVLGKAPDFFLFRHAGRTDILALVLALVLIPALGMWTVELLSGLAVERLRRLVHLIMVAALLAVLALEIGKRLTPLRGAKLLVAVALGGLFSGLLYRSYPGFRLWLRYLSPAPIVFALVFLLISPVSQLVVPRGGGGAVGAGAPGVHIAARTPVVMVLFDEFPLTSLLDSKGKIDARLYPNFAALAGRSTWYRNATAVSGYTAWAVPAMLSGRYPAKILPASAAEYPNNLFTLLGESYDVENYEVVTQLCPPKTCKGSPPTAPAATGLRAVLHDSVRIWKRIVWPVDVDEDPTGAWLNPTEAKGRRLAPKPGSDPVSPVLQEIASGNEPRYFRDFVASVERSDRPTFYFLHLLLPHKPWHRLPSGLTYPERERGDGQNGNGWTTEPWPPQLARQRHLMQTVAADRVIGQIVRRLKEQGMYDKTLLVVTADHGMSFIPNVPRRVTANERNADQVLWVPLFIKQPGQDAGRVTDQNWEHVDLVPTIADILGIRVPWAQDGVSQAGAEARARTEKWFYSRPGQRTIFPGPANQARALNGITDRMLRPDHGYLGWFQTGRFADLVGKHPSQIGIEPASGGTAQVDDLADYGRVDPASGSVPAEVTGQLNLAGDAPAQPAVAVAVNGVIGGISETFREQRIRGTSQPQGPADKFAAITPDTLFRKGANRLELFLVDTSSGHNRLRPLTIRL